MNEATDRASSSLALAEKKPHSPGGCVGIFFQLFDWNRRLAKKKLFSKKLLAPGTKQTARKFVGDEKMPKTKPLSIARESGGNFQNAKKNGSCGVVTEHKHEMRAAGLVARLMGLESMPAVHRDKHKKASNSAPCNVKEEKIGDTRFDGEVLNLEKDHSKLESRPQKLQKTGQLERQAITRFRAEAMQIRNVLSRSRKHHQPKLASPLKSPRISSSRNGSRATRLINAATRILEPGLQATNRAKGALTYPASVHYASKNEVLMGEKGLRVMSHDLMNQQQTDVNCDVSVGGSSMGQTSCKNCGNLLDVVESRPTMEYQPFACSSSVAYGDSVFSQRMERMKPRPLIFSPEKVRDEIYRQNQVKRSAAAERLDHPRPCREPILDRKHVLLEGQISGQLRSQHCKSPDDEPSSIALPQRNGAHHVMLVGRNEIPPRVNLNNLHRRRAPLVASGVKPKAFVASNRSVSGHTGGQGSTKSDSQMADAERKACGRHDDSLPQLIHRRTVNGGAHVERIGLVSPASVRQRNIKCDLMSGKTLEPVARTTSHASMKTRLASQGDNNRARGNKNHEVKSFTINSPLKHKSFVSSGLKESMDHFNNSSDERKLPLEERDVKTFLQRQFPLSGDPLGALLEQKLRELTSTEVDESTIRGSAPKRSTAMILQELISALVEQEPFSSDGHMLNAEASFQNHQKMGETSVGFSHGGDHLSPGSVLESSFSNDSCLSSSVDDNSGRRLLWDPVEYSFDQPQPAETNSDLVDSATSVNEGRTGSNMVNDLLSHIHKILQSINLVYGGLIGSRLAYVKEVILNGELLLTYAAARNSDRMKRSFLGSFLLEELESLAGTMQTNFSTLPGFEESKDVTEVGRFLFDSVIEFLGSKYGRYCNSGYKAWRRVPLCMNAEMLIEEVGEEVRRWTNMVGMNSDEIIEWEMSHSLGKWTDFEIEVFETGTDIGWGILEALVDEILKDFCSCIMNSF